MNDVTPSQGQGAKPRPSREDRQKHILEATLRCVRRSGFHGASMNDIAAEAKMSVGVIYRYFANKEAIIEAIVANDLAEMRAKFAEWDALPDEQLMDGLLDVLEMAIEHKYGADNAALGLEVLAEAGRNPRVAAIVEAADLEERNLGRNLCRRLSVHDDPVQLAATSEIMSMIFDGMMIRAIANPHTDRKALLAKLRQVIRLIVTLPAIP